MDEIIRTEEQKYYDAITDKIDEFADADQVFILWYLLQRYGEFVGLKDAIEEEPKNISEYASRSMAIRHLKTVEEMRDCLYYAIW